MRTTNILTAAIAVAPFLLAGCLGDPVEQEVKSEYVAVIVNNGDDKNGSVDYYYENDGSVVKNPFGYSYNATYRSIQMVGDRLCLVTNDNDAILTFDIMGRVLGTPKTGDIKTPRFATATQSYVFVSNWGEETGNGDYQSSFITVLDKYDYSFYKKLSCGSQAEGIIAYKDRLFVATGEGVEVFSTLTTDFVREATISASALTGHAKHFVVDSLDNIWVSYANGGLLCFDPTSRAIIRTLPDVPVDAETGFIAITKDGKKIISYTNTPAATVVATDILTGEQTELIEGDYNITAFGVSPFTNDILIADTAPGGESTFMVFDETGHKKGQTSTGPYTGYISFFGYFYY
ncbi:MAG: hypothetical protein LBG31_06120 [Prevotellaceae bacterium]|jgi:hypothetical protein|nr:hypothetical protein [Prevotellaceae bacterium]